MCDHDHEDDLEKLIQTEKIISSFNMCKNTFITSHFASMNNVQSANNFLQMF